MAGMHCRSSSVPGPLHVDVVSFSEAAKQSFPAGGVGEFVGSDPPVTHKLIQVSEIIVVVSDRDRGAQLGDEHREVLIIEMAKPGQIAEVAGNALTARFGEGPLGDV